jgi:hypothetical protein
MIVGFVVTILPLTCIADTEINMKTFILLLCLLAGSVKADEWTNLEISKQVAIGVLLIADMGQTLDIKNHYDCLEEKNPLLGVRPSDKKIYTYFLTAAILHTVLVDSLSTKHRAWLQNGTIALEIAVIGNNKHIGLSVKF